MKITMLKSKIHNAKVTESKLEYEGSLEVDKDFLEMTGILPYEKVLVSNIDNGSRFETYIIEGERGSKKIGLNGAAARLGSEGDRIIIFAFCELDEDESGKFKPKIIVLDEDNNVKIKNF
ncbi:aspartate 1-decarboxylase [candidate division KSB1 bacterium]